MATLGSIEKQMIKLEKIKLGWKFISIDSWLNSNY